VAKLSARGPTRVRIAAALLALAMVSLPMASAYMNPVNDNSKYVREKNCYCHDPVPSSNVTIVLKVPERATIPQKQTPVKVGVGIMAPPTEGIGFGLLLNASLNSTGVRWDAATVTGDGGLIPSWVKANLTAMWNTHHLDATRWFNASFIPGTINQTIDVTVIGMRTNKNGNETGDIWAIKTAKVEVRKQRLVTLNVTVRNNEPVSVTNLRVDFYIDDALVGTNMVNSVPASGKTNATVQWDATFAKDGKHKLRAVIDPDNNITETDKGNNVVTKDIWIGPLPKVESLAGVYAEIGRAHV
jgi:hypothetical protein